MILKMLGKILISQCYNPSFLFNRYYYILIINENIISLIQKGLYLIFVSLLASFKKHG